MRPISDEDAPARVARELDASKIAPGIHHPDMEALRAHVAADLAYAKSYGEALIQAASEHDNAKNLLRRVMEALDHELEIDGRVPFDPDEIRDFLGV